MTISKIAELLASTRTNISNLLNGKAGISPHMALKIEKVFGGSASHFLGLQLDYDLEKAENEFKSNPPKIKKYEYA